MRTRFMTALVMVAGLLLVVGQALAQLPTFQPGDVLRSGDLNRIVDQVRRNANAAGGSGGGATHNVDCTAGETIQSKVDAAQPGDTIMISGTCNEAVVVNKDGITLDGGGSAVVDAMDFDAPTISINGYQNVTIKGLTVQNGLSGVRLAESAVAWLEDVTAIGNRFKSGYESGNGIVAYTSSTVLLTGAVVANDNAAHGIAAGSASTVGVLGNYVVEGNRLPIVSVTASGNGGRGIEIQGNSVLVAFSAYAEYATVHAKNNGGAGIVVSLGASVSLYSGTTVEATGNGGGGLELSESASAGFYGWGAVSRGVTGVFNNNGGVGIAVWGSSALNVWDDGAAVNITATNNSSSGLSISDGSRGSFNSPASAPSSRLVFSDNGGDGISVDHNATLSSRLPSEMKSNAYEGLDAWGGSHVDLNAATVTDNDGHGLEVNTNSSMWLTTSRIANNNGGDGIQIGNNSTVHIHETEVMGNSGHGVSLYNHGFIQSLGGAGPTITGNGSHGVIAWNGASVQFLNAAISGNTHDAINASFGSRLHLDGGSITGNIYCDDSVLSQGDWVCPDGDDESDQ